MDVATAAAGLYLDSVLRERMFFLLLIWGKDQSAALQNLERLKGEEFLYKAAGEEGELLVICGLTPVKSELACRSQINGLVEAVASRLPGDSLIFGSRQSGHWESLPHLYRQVRELFSIRLYYCMKKTFSYQEYEIQLKNREISFEYLNIMPEAL